MPPLKIKHTDEMDAWLESEGYFRKRTARDSTCLFRAVSEQLLFTQIYYEEVRRLAVEYELRHKEIFQIKLRLSLEEYSEKMINEREAGGQLEIEAMARLWRRDFIVFKEVNALPKNVTNLGFEETIALCQTQEGHYDSVYTDAHVKNSAYCQSLIYSVLYKKVFKLKEVDYAVNKMLHDKNKITRKREQPNVNCANFILRLEFRETADDMRELLSRGITPFPYKVAKALDPTVYRNVEYDSWSEYRKGLRCGFCAWTCRGLQVGVRCSIQIDENTIYEGHVQEMKPNQGPVVVFVEKLGEKITVPYKAVTQLPPLKPMLPNNDRSYLRNSTLNFPQRSEESGFSKIKNSPSENAKGNKIPRYQHAQPDFEVIQDPQITSTTDSYKKPKDSYLVTQNSNYSLNAQISENEEPVSTTDCDQLTNYPITDGPAEEAPQVPQATYVANQARYPPQINYTPAVESGASSCPNYLSCTYSNHMSRYYGTWSVHPTGYLSPGIIVLPSPVGYVQGPVYSSPQDVCPQFSQVDAVEMNDVSSYPSEVTYQRQPLEAPRDTQTYAEPNDQPLVQHYEVSSTTTYTAAVGPQSTPPVAASGGVPIAAAYRYVETSPPADHSSAVTSAPAQGPITVNHFYPTLSHPPPPTAPMHHIATSQPIEFDIYECVPLVPTHQEYATASYVIGPEGEMYEAVAVPAAVVHLGPPMAPPPVAPTSSTAILPNDCHD